MIRCQLCNGITEPIRTPSDGKRYFRCSDCGFISLDREWLVTKEEEKARYLLHNNDPREPGYRRWLESFADFVDSARKFNPGNLRILDFGSGPVPALREFLQHPGDTVVIEDPYFAPGKRGGSFGLIAALEVLEHLEKPGIELRSLARRLDSGGILAVSTQFLPSEAAHFDGWSYRNDRTHIGFFTEDSLVSWASGYGLRKIAGDGVRYLAFQKDAIAPVETAVLG